MNILRGCFDLVAMLSRDSVRGQLRENSIGLLRLRSFLFSVWASDSTAVNPTIARGGAASRANARLNTKVSVGQMRSYVGHRFVFRCRFDFSRCSCPSSLPLFSPESFLRTYCGY